MNECDLELELDAGKSHRESIHSCNGSTETHHRTADVRPVILFGNQGGAGMTTNIS
jgi:hypothetical protein